MATEAGTESEQTTDTSNADVVEETAAETPQVEQEATEDGDPPEPETESETEAAPAAEPEKPQGLVVTLAEDVEEPPPPAGDKASKAWAELRKKAREAERERDELKARLSAPVAEAAPVLPPEPDLADADVQFDKDLFKRKWARWNEAKAKVDAHQAKAKTEQAKRDEEWAKEQQRYKKSIEAISAKVPNYGDAERFVASLLDANQQVFLLESTEDTAKVVLALSQHPDKAKELAAIKSLPKFTRALVELEKSMTVKDSTKKPKAPPEKSVASAGSSPAASNLEALEKEALKTGDLTKVIAEKRRLRQLQESRKK